jgi:hypothetical protein
MEADPTESKDLASLHKDRVESMLSEYIAWEKEVGVRDFKGRRYGERPAR